MKEDYPLKEFKTARSFETWLSKNHAKAPGIRVKFAKKSSGLKSITFAEALDIALCYGWIDGQGKGLDDQWYSQRFTPRRARSTWSKINRENVARLIEEGRMQPAGQAEIARAKADGRWDAAYDPPSKATVPDDLAKALKKKPKAARFFETLNSQNRYAILHRIQTAKKPETRAKRIDQFVEMLNKGEKIYP
jgi:uncharacterized protein YdeI (YjbR/CyaY-like superfamily)